MGIEATAVSPKGHLRVAVQRHYCRPPVESIFRALPLVLLYKVDLGCDSEQQSQRPAKMATRPGERTGAQQ